MFLYDSATYRKDLSTAISAVPRIRELHNSSIMITGATGLIGSFLVDMLLEYNRLEDAGIHVYALGRSEKRLKVRFEGAITDHLHFVEHDVNQPPTFDFAIDYVIHAASNAYPASFAEDPVGTILNNVFGTQYLLHYAKEHQAKRFLFVSSGEVYGQGDPNLKAFSEHFNGYVDPTEPRSCYPCSKRTAETLCVSYTQQYGLETVIARPCHIYGPNTTASDNRASVQFMNNAVNGEDILMKSRGTQMRSYCYVADCASAILTILLCGQSKEAYNVANPNARVTIAELAEAIAETAGRKVVFSELEPIAKEQQTPITYAVLDSDKLCALGWKGNYTIEQGVLSTYQVLTER